MSRKGVSSKIFWILTVSDVLILSGMGCIAPILAVFLTQQVKADLAAVGLATTIFLLLRSGLQIPLGQLIDRVKGEKDDFWAMIIGSMIVSLVPLLYLVIKTPGQLFLVQGLYGIGGALTYPSWMAIFTRHLDKKKIGWQWSVYQATVDLGGAMAAGVGGFLAKTVGFNKLFIFASAASFLGSGLLLKVSRGLKLRS